MLVAAMNPSPAGYGPDSSRTVNPQQMQKYLSRISGPLLDRIDIHIEVPAVPFRDLANKHEGTSSSTMREKVMLAREIQSRRFEGESKVRLNGRMSTRQIRKFCQLDEQAEGLLKAAMEEMDLSARAHDRILRVARTIADLEASPDITVMHISEAINYRSLDRKYWN